MKVYAVIGANYGDEGKGLITDYLASKSSRAVVVRFNGGAQAGHTVVTPDGRRHVFHHFGSGSFTGATTFLSRYFICNPMFFKTEYDQLVSLGVAPNLVVDPGCAVTTPYDLMLNQAVEQSRGDARHGSCGMGINETIHRNEDPRFLLNVQDLLQEDRYLERRLKAIRDDYVPQRADQLRISAEMPFLHDDRIIDRFIYDVRYFRSRALFRYWGDFDIEGHDIIFEGAQGLHLDMDSPDFPHVTRSKTGIVNVLRLCRERGIQQRLDAYYVTRPYLTRHGAGPLKNELTGESPCPKFEDNTNVFNEHQQHLRTAPLDVDVLNANIWNELVPGKGVPDDELGRGIDVRTQIALTCVDHLDGSGVKFMKNIALGMNQYDAVCVLTPEAFVQMLGESVDADHCLMSYGPTRADVREFRFN